MAVKNVNEKSWELATSPDGRRHSAYSSGDAPSGGSAALGWYAPNGVAVGERILLMSDGTHNLVIPSNERFTGFSQSSAAAGSNVALGDTQFTGLNRTPKYSDIARGQGRSWDAFQERDDGTYSASGGGITQFDAPSAEIFLSYAIRVPATSIMPENTAGTWGAGEFPNDSFFKVAWLLGPYMGDGDVDICLPTFIPSAWLSGNGLVYPPLRTVGRAGVGYEPDWWRWDKWIRISAWLKSGADPDVDGCKMFFEVCNTEDVSSYHTYSYSGSTPLFAGKPEPHGWGGINIPGWSDGAATKQADFLYTDVAIRWGQRSAARLEVGNASTYGACTDKAICPAVKRYSGRCIEYQIERGGISLAGDSWLYYTDADNVTTLVGKLT